ncbi:hypothetical protein QR680_001958 [Steinernema hermaphroditum]|uniref:Activin types I and II receptor domain-containing protein n=1 Tax=Steinernema hermaphroditum TaxID=289476 RepID=A0AA39LHA3_9BILA|nr:hypothetical protein QR680_001958 [Steinernema hermaphroditum]
MVVRGRSPSSALTLFLLFHYGFWLITPSAVSALECFNFHDFSEEGKQRTITRGFCGASNGYCVKAVYSDERHRSKNGFSLGCDKTDCVGVGGNGWSSDGCKHNEDYGSEGMICCCTTDLCNGVPQSCVSLVNSLIFPSLLMVTLRLM